MIRALTEGRARGITAISAGRRPGWRLLRLSQA
jgi:hypothetical protein